MHEITFLSIAVSITYSIHLAVISSHLVRDCLFFVIYFNLDIFFLGYVQLVPDIHVASIGTVLAQGMNSKKKHEVGNLALC